MSRLGDRAGMGHNSEVGKLGQTTLNGRSAQRYTHIAEDRERRPIGVSTYESRFLSLGKTFEGFSRREFAGRQKVYHQ